MSKTKAKTSPKKKAAKKAPQAKRFRPTLTQYRAMTEQLDELEADLDGVLKKLANAEESHERLWKDLEHERARFRECEKALRDQIQITEALTAQNIQASNLLEDAYAKTLERTPERQAKITEIIKNHPRKYKIS